MQSENVCSRSTVGNRLAALLFAAGSIACLAPITSAAAPRANANEVKWSNNAVTRFAPMRGDEMKGVVTAELNGAERKRVLVQLDAIPDAAQRANLEAKGARSKKRRITLKRSPLRIRWSKRAGS